jgi:hypothetical protein
MATGLCVYQELVALNLFSNHKSTVMKTNKLILGLTLVFVGIMLVSTANAQSQQAPAGLKPELPYVPNGGVNLPDGYVIPTSPSVGAVNDGIEPEMWLESPDNQDRSNPKPATDPVDPLPNYQNVNVTNLKAPDGTTVQIKVESYEDAMPAFNDTGDPMKDNQDHEKAIQQWLLNNPH